MQLSAVGLGGLLAHYWGQSGHPPPENRRIYLRAAELEAFVDKHCTNVRRDAIDILRLHSSAFTGDEALRAKIDELKHP